MARKRIVSRTVTETICTVLVADPAAQKFSKEVIRVQGEHKPVELMKLVTKKWGRRAGTPLAIESSRVEETLYAMDEDDFIAAAYVIEGGR